MAFHPSILQGILLIRGCMMILAFQPRLPFIPYYRNASFSESDSGAINRCSSRFLRLHRESQACVGPSTNLIASKGHAG
jgi:hypothetical protein